MKITKLYNCLRESQTSLKNIIILENHGNHEHQQNAMQETKKYVNLASICQNYVY